MKNSIVKLGLFLMSALLLMLTVISIPLIKAALVDNSAIPVNRVHQNVQTVQSQVGGWSTYTSPHNNYFIDIEYPSNFYAGDSGENGLHILQIQTAPGVMTLPGETSCMEVYDNCNDVSSGLRIEIFAIPYNTPNVNPSEHLVGFGSSNLEPTAYHSVRKVKDLSQIEPVQEPVNLKSAYFYSGSRSAAYRIEVYEKDFQGDVEEVLEHLFTSLESNKRFGLIENLSEVNGNTELSVDLAQFFPFWEAPAAAEEDGNCVEIVDGKCKVAPPGIYIRNLTHELTDFPVSPDVKVLTKTYDLSSAGIVKPISFEVFKDALDGTDTAHAYMQDKYYFLELRDGEIITIFEMFEP